MATIILLVLLLAGTTAAFAYTQALKSERSPLGVPRFERKLAPTCDCPAAEATLRLRLREADRVSAEIVDADGTVVRTLAEDEAEPSGPLAFTWDGRDEEGQVAPDGPYRLRVSLAGADRTILYPTTIRVDATAPRLELVSVRPDELVPGERRRFKIRYRASEEARPILAVGKVDERAEVVARGPYRPAGRSKIDWRGTIGGVPVAPGDYVLTLRVRDRFGNRSDPVTAQVTVLEGSSG